MARLRVHNFSISVDGYGAGPQQSLENPIGVGGRRLHDWLFVTRTFGEIFGTGGSDVGLDDGYARQGETGIGATIMGRNMFGPIRGTWEDGRWTGWWGDDPPFHHPVFVLTHYAREPITMAGGTTFYFVTGGIHDALEQAIDAAGGLDVRLGGGVATIQQFLRARLIDELHLAIVPVLLGRGERLFAHVDDATCSLAAKFECSPSVVHVRLTRTGDGNRVQTGPDDETKERL
jgi:dihydrofolate reductase